MALAKKLPPGIRANGKTPTKHGRMQYSFLVSCIACGVEREVKRKDHAIAMSVKPCKWCSNKSNHPQGEVNGVRVSFFNTYRLNAADRRKSWDLSIEDAAEILASQDSKCALSGIPIAANGDFTDITASLDRVDNAEGYSNSNVQWVHKEINMMRGVLSVERFKELCDLVSHKSPKETPPLHE